LAFCALAVAFVLLALLACVVVGFERGVMNGIESAKEYIDFRHWRRAGRPNKAEVDAARQLHRGP
jgi:hypothetical protein